MDPRRMSISNSGKVDLNPKSSSRDLKFWSSSHLFKIRIQIWLIDWSHVFHYKIASRRPLGPPNNKVIQMDYIIHLSTGIKYLPQFRPMYLLKTFYLQTRAINLHHPSIMYIMMGVYLMAWIERSVPRIFAMSLSAVSLSFGRSRPSPGGWIDT